jgi:uncharacterized protein (TIGR03086 family)
MHINFSEMQKNHQRAARLTVEVVSQVSKEDLARPTPCADWKLADLLAHMTVQNHGFAVAAAGAGADPALWHVGAPGPDPVADYVAATEEMLTAFAAEDMEKRLVALPEIGPDPFPAAQAALFQFIDCVVHGWDVARSLGRPYQPDADLVAAALPIVEIIPDDDNRLQPGAAFRPALGVSDETTAMDRILLLLGRSPSWPN